MTLFTPPELTADDLAVIDAIDKIQTSIRLNMATPRRWTGRLRRYALARAIRGSNSIERIEVDQDNAFAAVSNEDPHETDRKVWEAIIGHRDAMTYILTLANEPNFEHSQALLKSLHFMIQRYDLTMSPGHYRPGSIYVFDDDARVPVYEGPDHLLVPSLMAELVAELNMGSAELPAMVRAAMAHLNLVMIHPFRNGNGRMARALQTLVLVRDGVTVPEFISIEENLAHNERAYYDVLALVGQGNWSPHGDTAPWVRFNLASHFRQARTVERRIRLAESIALLADQSVEGTDVPERSLSAIEHALSGYTLRNNTYRALQDREMSQTVASRDLQALVTAGILEQRGAKRGAHYLPVEALRKQVFEARRKARNAINVSEDPYELLR